LSLGVPLAILLQSLASCGSDSEDRACDPGAFKACAVAGQTCEAIQTCNADGSAYGECACPGGNGSAGSAGAGGSGGSSNAAGGAAGAAAGPVDPVFEAIDRVMGAPCTTDTDCPAAPNGDRPLFCITPTSTTEFETGSPEGGYCSAPCETIDDCQLLDGLSACSGAGYCIGLCQPGNGANALKCDPGRAQACIANPNMPTIGACLPICESDAGCGTGLFCDLGLGGVLGLCTATPPPGGDVGAPCSDETAEADCKSGICLTFIEPDGSDAGSFCSGLCTFGSIGGCGFADQISVPRDAICGQPEADDGGGGDIGFCRELCDVDTDCAQSAAGWICSPDLTPDGEALTGRTGLCQPPGGDVPVDAGL
jgi:hypothetical protein